MRRRMTPGERALWRRAVRDVKPLGSIDGGKAQFLLEGSPRGLPAVKMTPRAPGAGKHQQNDPFSAGDPKADRLVRRGRKPIDATFDLHGHTQVTARAALYGFLLEARTRGHESVLVITGKGGTRDHAGRGVLHTRFKDWVSEEAFRQHIIRVAPAHARHGGGGAFYVFLKTARRK